MRLPLHRVVALCACVLPVFSSALSASGQAWNPKVPVPPVGEHPRIFFTAGELPAMRERLTTGVFGKAVEARFAWARRDFPGYRQFAALELTDAEAARAQLDAHFKPDEQRNIKWGLLAIDAVVRNDAEQKRVMAGVISNYARLILASKELKVGGKVRNLTGKDLSRHSTVWDNPNFGVGQSWLFGAAGLPVAYDLLHGDMTPEQREVVRKALVTATTGRKPHGAGEPRGRAISNHYGYHGELAVMLAAIEGTEGFDAQAWADIRQILLDYWDVGFTPEGACHEDSYGPNLGLRAGALGLVALARRGDDVFATPKFAEFLKWNVHEIEPFAGGTLIGGASGIGLDYNTSLIVGRFVRPDEPAAHYLYTHDLGADLKNVAGQCALHFALFGSEPKATTAADVKLPLTVFAPRRGKLITRSDWSPEATVLHFDARPDAFTIGHDAADRGNFSLITLGRTWTRVPSFRQTTESKDFASLPRVDGEGQAYKAPSVKWLARADGALATLGAADLKYAYDWQWSPPSPWPTKETKFPAPWEPERSDPRALGWPTEPGQDADWMPKSLYGEPGIGYQGSWLWRRPHNVVERAFRTAGLVRGKQPWAFVVDDFRKDGRERTYTWQMQLASDLNVQVNGREAVLTDETGRRLVVRVVQAEGFESIALEKFDRPATQKGKPPEAAQRLVVTAKTADPKFKVIFLPVASNAAAPASTLTGGELAVGEEKLTLTALPTGRTGVTVRRGAERVELK